MILTDEQELFRQSVREFAEKTITPYVAMQLDHGNTDLAVSLVKPMADFGLFELPYGDDADHVAYAIAIEEVSRASASAGVILAAHASLAMGPIASYGTPLQHKLYLSQMRFGDWLGAFALTEPGAGSDVAAGKTTATPAPAGYTLKGSKIFISNAPYAHVYIVFANAPGGPSAFIVERGTPGFTIGDPERKMGIHGSSTCPLYFSNCWIPAGALLGSEGDGFKIAMKTLDLGRIGCAAQAVGIAQASLDASIAYAKERVQFGKPIAALQAIQFMIADMAAETEAARLLVYNAAANVNAGKRYGTEGSMAKLIAGETATRVAGKAIQIHGGYGYTESYPVERYYRDAKITEIYEGTSEIQRMTIARAVLR